MKLGELSEDPGMKALNEIAKEAIDSLKISRSTLDSLFGLCAEETKGEGEGGALNTLRARLIAIRQLAKEIESRSQEVHRHI